MRVRVCDCVSRSPVPGTLALIFIFTVHTFLSYSWTSVSVKEMISLLHMDTDFHNWIPFTTDHVVRLNILHGKNWDFIALANFNCSIGGIVIDKNNNNSSTRFSCTKTLAVFNCIFSVQRVRGRSKMTSPGGGGIFDLTISFCILIKHTFLNNIIQCFEVIHYYFFFISSSYDFTYW